MQVVGARVLEVWENGHFDKVKAKKSCLKIY